MKWFGKEINTTGGTINKHNPVETQTKEKTKQPNYWDCNK